MVSPRRTTVPGSAIQASVPPTSLEMRASLRLTTVPVAEMFAREILRARHGDHHRDRRRSAALAERLDERKQQQAGA